MALESLVLGNSYVHLICVAAAVCVMVAAGLSLCLYGYRIYLRSVNLLMVVFGIILAYTLAQFFISRGVDAVISIITGGVAFAVLLVMFFIIGYIITGLIIGAILAFAISTFFRGCPPGYIEYLIFAVAGGIISIFSLKIPVVLFSTITGSLLVLLPSYYYIHFLNGSKLDVQETLGSLLFIALYFVITIGSFILQMASCKNVQEEEVAHSLNNCPVDDEVTVYGVDQGIDESTNKNGKYNDSDFC